MKCFFCDTNASYRSIYNIPANETTRHSFVGLSHLWPKKKEKDVSIKLSFNNVSQTQASPCFSTVWSIMSSNLRGTIN